LAWLAQFYESPLLVAAIRIAATAALFATVAALWRRGGTRFLLSPALFIALQCVLLYSAFISTGLRYGEREWLVTVAGANLQNYSGSRAEAAVLGFGMLALFAALYPHRRDGRATHSNGAYSTLSIGSVALLATATALAGSAFYLAEAHIPAIADFGHSGIGREIHHILAPAISFSLAVLVFGAVKRPAVIQLSIGLLVVVCALSMMRAMQAPVPIFMMFGLGLLWCVGARISLRRAAALGVGCCLLFAAVIQAKTNQINVRENRVPAVTFTGTLASKLLVRQMTSAGCLNNIFERGAAAGLSGNPFYFAGAIVPRAFYPDKPNLSRGAEFAQNHCGRVISVNPDHSESITLLGEPMLEARYAGLIAAQAVLLVLLCLLTRAAASPAAIGPVFVAATLPWTAAFQQHFALYLANGLKMFLAMIPLAVLFWLCCRLGRRAARP
jgi:hypothetical protein